MLGGRFGRLIGLPVGIFPYFGVVALALFYRSPHEARWGLGRDDRKEKVMKLIASALVAMIGAAVLVGCEASAKVGDPDHVDTSTDTHTTYKKTTVTTPSGDTSVKTEKKTTTY